MTNAIPKPGFYGNDSQTVYVTPSGRAWCVQSDDLIDLPREWPGGPGAIEGLRPCGDLIDVFEQLAYLRKIQAESGEVLIEEA